MSDFDFSRRKGRPGIFGVEGTGRDGRTTREAFDIFRDKFGGGGGTEAAFEPEFASQEEADKAAAGSGMFSKNVLGQLKDPVVAGMLAGQIREFFEGPARARLGAVEAATAPFTRGTITQFAGTPDVASNIAETIAIKKLRDRQMKEKADRETLAGLSIENIRLQNQQLKDRISKLKKGNK